ncbi:MAG TPA: hypothetical protein DEO43_00045 [Halieaceae bacterium]|nr:hypothetical protein [Halieaceae bacterium]
MGSTRCARAAERAPSLTDKETAAASVKPQGRKRVQKSHADSDKHIAFLEPIKKNDRLIRN